MKRRDEVNRIVTDAIIKSDYEFSSSAFYDVADECSETMMHKAFKWFITHYLEYINAEPIGSSGAVAYTVKIADAWEAYKKAMEE